MEKYNTTKTQNSQIERVDYGVLVKTQLNSWGTGLMSDTICDIYGSTQ